VAAFSDADERAELLRLASVPGLGPVAMARLARRFPGPRAVFEAGPAAWAAAEIPERLWPAIEAARSLDVSHVLSAVDRAGAWLVGIFDGAYPALLREIYDPPPVLYGKGHLGCLAAPCVAVVGARRVTRYGADHGYRVARGLAEAGVTVVSGLAVGLDAVAHGAALDAGGRTAAVLGSGVANIYPGLHAELAGRICREGALLSELPPGAAAEKAYFPRRNRIISGLCRAVVVIEARDDSGSLITAGQALEQGREVMVVPGPAGGTNRGGHRLLAQGAGWVEEAKDVLAVLRGARGAAPAAAGGPEPPKAEPELPAAWAPVWSALRDVPEHVDALIARSGLRTAEVLGILLQLELRGIVRQLPNKHFHRLG
jgi:DNA processing protein